jgi:hypothetical protein
VEVVVWGLELGPIVVVEVEVVGGATYRSPRGLPERWMPRRTVRLMNALPVITVVAGHELIGSTTLPLFRQLHVSNVRNCAPRKHRDFVRLRTPLHERAPGVDVVDVRELEIVSVSEALVVGVTRHATPKTEEHELVIGRRLRKAVDLEEPAKCGCREIEHGDPCAATVTTSLASLVAPRKIASD